MYARLCTAVHVDGLFTTVATGQMLASDRDSLLGITAVAVDRPVAVASRWQAAARRQSDDSHPVILIRKLRPDSAEIRSGQAAATREGNRHSVISWRDEARIGRVVKRAPPLLVASFEESVRSRIPKIENEKAGNKVTSRQTVAVRSHVDFPVAGVAIRKSESLTSTRMFGTVDDALRISRSDDGVRQRLKKYWPVPLENL